MTSLGDLPQKTQYIIVDSNFVRGTNNIFSVDLTLESNTHVEDMGKVIGVKMVDFYLTQVGENNANLSTNVAKFVDIICPDIPKKAQLLDERSGLIFARVPLERHFGGSNGIVIRDKQWKSFPRANQLFNPISIKSLNFKIYEYQDDGDYVLLQPDASWHMVLEITTIDVKEKPKDKNVQILQALDKLCSKIDTLNKNVAKLPDKPPEGPKKKYPFAYLLLLVASLFGGWMWWLSKKP
ncbi:hypothetical protein [Dishui Lake phycodnavirus 2]|nr:hypothetical protein [Dishui Lake phycodnavirus 2]